MTRRAVLLTTTTSLLIAFAAAPATAAAPAGSVTTTSDAGEDIVVTAQKRAQTLIDVPQSISVVTGAALERQVATNFQDYLKLVPGLQLDQSTPGAGRLILRGINTGGFSSTVAVYEDETPFGSSTGLANGATLAGDFDTFDVARIEVLRGPQGTLYGASSLGGVVKFVTNLPETDRLSLRGRGGVETTKGGDVSYYGNAVINVPLSDTLAVRASGSYYKYGGWIDSIGTGGSQVRDNVNDSRTYDGRASVLWKPTPNISLRASALLQNIDVNAASAVESDPATLQTSFGRQTESVFANPSTKVSYRLYNGTATIGLGFATLTSSTSYSTQKQPNRIDYTAFLGPIGPFGPTFSGIFGTPLFVNDQNVNLRRLTQEVRLAGNFSPVFEWVIGGYYDHEKAAIRQNFAAVSPGSFAVISTGPALGLVTLASRYDEIAGFASGTLHLGEHFDLDVGGRYSHNAQDATQNLSGLLAGKASTFTQNSSEGVFTYSAAPKIKFSQNASLYGRVAKGFRPGGPNALAPGAPAAARTFGSDSVVSYEVGLKAQTADKTASIDVAVFHIDWSRIQLATVLQTPSGPFNFNGNGGSAKSDGVEFTGTVRPTPGFDVSLNGAITNARLTTNAPAASGFAGDKLPFTPRYSLALNADYQWTMGNEIKPYIGASLRYLSKQRGNFDAVYIAATGGRATIPSYPVVDLHAGLEAGRYGLEVYARNLNNAEGKTSVSTIGFAPNGATDTGVIRPRTIGAALTVSY